MVLEMVVLFVFGTILGSFINALAFRHNTGLSMWGRSACTSCGKELQSQDLVPILSYLFLRGRCRFCKSGISLQYPLVEILAGLISIACYETTGGVPASFFFAFMFFMLLLFIAIYDIRHTIIPDSFVFTAAAVALISHVATNSHSFFLLLPYIYAGLLLAIPLFLIWLFSGGRAMGLGDSKLVLATGFFLGLSSGAVALIVAFWMGALWGLALLFLSSRGWMKRRVRMKSELPFGPFIIAGAALCFFLHIDFFSFLSWFAI